MPPTSAPKRGAAEWTDGRSARRDGRAASELRALQCRLSELPAADGSATFQQGSTAVLATVFGPAAARNANAEIPDRASVAVSVTRLAGAPAGGGATRIVGDAAKAAVQRGDAELAAALTRLFSHVALTERYPRCAIRIAVTVLADDGAVWAAAVNAAMAALLDAAVPCRVVVAAAAVALASSGVVVVDPDGAEEAEAAAANAPAGAGLVALATYAFALPQAGGGAALARVRASPAAAALSQRQLAALEDAAAGAAEGVFEFLRRCAASASVAAPRESEGIAV